MLISCKNILERRFTKGFRSLNRATKINSKEWSFNHKCFSRKVELARRHFSAFPYDHGQSYILENGVSHVRGPETPEVMNISLDEAFRDTVNKFPQRQAIVVCEDVGKLEQTLSYAELDAKISELSRGMIRLGIKHGDRVAIWMPNNLEWVLVHLACARIGAISVCINPSYKKRELAHAINLAGVSVLFMTPAVGKNDFIGILDELLPSGSNRTDEFSPFSSSDVPSLKHIVVAEVFEEFDVKRASRFIKFEQMLEKNDLINIDRKMSPDEACNIQFTSGTTGSPKGATLSSSTIVNNGAYVGSCIRLQPSDILCLPVPIYHCFGLVCGNLAAFANGSSVVFPSRTFSAKKALEAVDKHGCTALYGVPTMFIEMLKEPNLDSFRLKSLRTGIMAGSTCPVEVMRQAGTQMNLSDLCIAFGSTETGPVSFMTRIDDEPEIRCTTVGRVLPNTECKVVNEQGHVVPIGDVGELLVKGYLTMNEYWRDEARSKSAFTEDGYYKTGDSVSMDENGYLRVLGRMRDVVIRGGENLFPVEIENIILELPFVHQCQAVGIPDPKYGEEMCAVVQLTVGIRKELDNSIIDHSNQYSQLEAEVKDYVRSQVSNHKVPKYILFTNDLSDFLTSTGKVRKIDLSKWAASKVLE